MHKFLAITLFCLLGATSLASATELEQSMKRMSKAYKQLADDLKQPVDASKADYLKLAAALKTEAQTSRNFVPKLVAALPQGQQPAQIAAYQKSLDALGATIDVLSKDLTAGSWADANKQIAVMKDQMIDGHKKFRKKEDHDGHAPAEAPTPAPAASTAPVPASTNAPAATPPTQ